MKRILIVLMAIFFCMPNVVSAESPPDNINAKSYFLTEAESGEVLKEYNADEKLPIASVTKIMTMLLSVEAIDSGKITPDDMVPVSERAMSMGGSTMFLEVGEQLSVRDMLKGIAVASANDGAVAMAEFIAGSETAFVDMMNEKASSLGMENTHFVNTNGLDAEEHYSTARDVAIMSRELIKHKQIFEYTTIWTDSLRGGKFELANTNKLIRFYSGANGLKTGSTSKALCCISATAKRDDMQLIAVVLGAPTSKERFDAARSLLDYGFAMYSVNKFAEKGQEMCRVSVVKGKKGEISAVAEENCSLLTLKANKNSITQKVNVLPELSAPIEKGEIIGNIEFYSGDELKKSLNLTAGENVEKKTFFCFFKDALLKLISC